MTHRLADHADRFAAAALGHVAREYPHVMTHAMSGPEPPFVPSEQHPIFFGSYDWHSCVHSHWLLARLLRLFPNHPFANEVRAHVDQALTPEKVAGEVAYFEPPIRRGFERPYGWGWLLKLAAELREHDAGWGEALRPLERLIVARFEDFLPRADYPIRTGSHGNTAFALVLALDYAQAAGDVAFASQIEGKARDWYERDADARPFEPSGDDFLSPTLMEAALMKAVLPSDVFTGWFSAFLPRLGEGEPTTLFQPVGVSDRSDGKIAHLDGLNLSSAWCWRRLAEGRDDAAAMLMQEAAERRLAASLPHVTGDYMGEHWLASFALLALE